MLNYRCTIKSIQTKDGRVIAPSTRIDVVPWPEASANGGWRIAFLAGERGGIVKVSEQDLKAKTAPDFPK
jgi:hypothetical protein